jgi:predicted TIM-barrel fold metal-dependent hydrolase
LLYAGIFRKYTGMKIVLAHCGGSLPVLSGRLQILGDAQWIPNPNKIIALEIKEHLNSLYLDTAATSATGIHAGLLMTTVDHIVYGSDCAVPCTTDNVKIK